MPFCANCGNNVGEGIAFCTNCGKSLKQGEGSDRRGRKRNKVAWFFIGLLVVLAIGGILYVVEQASLPFELRVQIATVEEYRKLPPEIQFAIAHQLGVTVEELLISAYDRWAPKVLIGLLSAYGGAWVIYLLYSFFRFVDKGGSSGTPTK